MINISAIKLPTAFLIYKNTKGEKKEFLEPVSKINIFVGSNNSGKSRFMRELSKQDSYEAKIQNSNLADINSEILEYITSIESKFYEQNISEINHLSSDELSRIKSELKDSLNLSSENYENIKFLIRKWVNYKDTGKALTRSDRLIDFDIDTKRLLEGIIKSGAAKIFNLLKQIPDYQKSDNPLKVYIPTLRGLRQLDEAHTDFYLTKTRQDYFPNQIKRAGAIMNPEELKNPEVFTGLKLYESIDKLRSGLYPERNLFNKYQKFIGNEFFEGKQIELTPYPEEKVVIVKIGNEKEQPIHHLGDGIQSAIILSFLPFVMQEQTFFFIEEPEMYLHPGLQRKILEFYARAEECKKHTFFMTTHSNHFLDITIDIKDVSIFTFNKILDESSGDEQTPNFAIEAVDSGCESSLELLGVRNSSVFLVNATIWVEGITDRWYLRKMLESYMKYLEDSENEILKMRLEEDTHYSFVEYGGANITHWSFLDKEERPIEIKTLCAKAMVIVDDDGGTKLERKEKLREVLGDDLIILPCREVENLLPYKVIKEIVSEYENNPELVIKDFKYEQYKEKPLGKFIEEKMLNKNPKRSYKADSGTLKIKKEFCNKAIDKIEYVDLPESTQTVVQQIYEFIYKRNSDNFRDHS